MAKRQYDQYCALARALDVVGERWTLLVVRELLPGPKRYTDLLDALPGIGTNLLAARLKELESGGIIERSHLPAPAASSVYELTEYGRELESAVVALTRWGSRRLGSRKRGEHFRPGWFALALQSQFRSQAAGDARASYEFRIDDDVLHVRIEDGSAHVRHGPASEPDLVVTMDSGTLGTVLSRRLSFLEAVERGRIEVEGDRTALARFADLFGLARPKPAAVAR
jgi:DNA-binding HxlR family transcriptional regulator/putative sterol carrier protein